MRNRCPKCGKLLIEPMGYSGSSYLLVGEAPGYKETMQGRPFAFSPKPPKMFAGDILKAELIRVGIDINKILVTNVWQHEVSEKACDLQFHLDQLVRLFADRTHVLLMGSASTLPLVGRKANEVSGTRVQVPVFPQIHFWVAPTPSSAFGQPIGELRLAFQRFAEDTKRS